MPYCSFSWCLHLLTHLWWVYRVFWPDCRGVARWQICSALHPTLTRSSSYPFLTGIGLCHCDLKCFWRNLFRRCCVGCRWPLESCVRNHRLKLSYYLSLLSAEKALLRAHASKSALVLILLIGVSLPSLFFSLSSVALFFLYFFLALYLFIYFLVNRCLVEVEQHTLHVKCLE